MHFICVEGSGIFWEFWALPCREFYKLQRNIPSGSNYRRLAHGGARVAAVPLDVFYDAAAATPPPRQGAKRRFNENKEAPGFRPETKPFATDDHPTNRVHACSELETVCVSFHRKVGHAPNLIRALVLNDPAGRTLVRFAVCKKPATIAACAAAIRAHPVLAAVE